MSPRAEPEPLTLEEVRLISATRQTLCRASIERLCATVERLHSEAEKDREDALKWREMCATTDSGPAEALRARREAHEAACCGAEDSEGRPCLGARGHLPPHRSMAEDWTDNEKAARG